MSATWQVRFALLAVGSIAAVAVVVAGWPRQATTPEPGKPPDLAASGKTAERTSASGAVPARLRVHGRVLAPDGSEAEGADVAVFHLEGSEPVLPAPEAEGVSRTGAHGRFDFEVPRGGDLAVGARMPGFISMLVPVGDGRRELMLRLADAYEVRGYVSEYFAPVEGCEVVLESEDDRFSRVTKTGADGAFRFSEIYPGLVSLTARTTLYRPAVRSGVVVGSSEPLRLQFHEAGLSIVGHVWLDPEGTVPAAGARVRATAQRDGRTRRHAMPQEATVDAEGGFRLLGLGSGPYRIEVSHAQRSTAVRTLEVDEKGTGDLDVRLMPRAPVRGRLAGAASSSVDLLLVSAARERARTRTDTGGRFEFAESQSVGPATLVLLDRSLCFESTSSRHVTVEVGSPEVLTLSVAQSILLVGDVVDPEGAPIAGVEVYVESERLRGIDLLREPVAVTDADGRYQINVADNAAVELTFEHPAYATLTQLLAPEASGIQQAVTLHPPSRIMGRVVRDDRPLPAAIVHLATEGPTRGWATTGPDGGFVLHGVPAGVHELFVRHGTLSELSARVRVEPGRDAEPVILTLPPARTIEGVVVDPQRRGVAGVLVGIEGTSGIAVPTDAAGRFALDAPRGEVELRAVAPGWRLVETRPIAAGVDRVEIVLPLPPHGRLTARLLGAPGASLRGALLTFEPLDAVVGGEPRVSHWIDLIDGGLDFDRLPAGKWRIAVRGSGYTPFIGQESVAAGAVVDLGVCRLEPGARVRGVVVDESGGPVAGARVMLGDEDDALVVIEAARARTEDLFGVRADLRGRFEITGVSSRANTLVVMARGYAPQEVTVKIPADVLRRDPLVVTLTRGVDIIAQVVDGTGRAVSGKMVELTRNGFTIDVGRTDGDGRCSFHNRSRGEYQIAVPGTPVADTVEVLQQQTYHVRLRLGDR